MGKEESHLEMKAVLPESIIIDTEGNRGMR